MSHWFIKLSTSIEENYLHQILPHLPLVKSEERMCLVPLKLKIQFTWCLWMLVSHKEPKSSDVTGPERVELISCFVFLFVHQHLLYIFRMSRKKRTTINFDRYRNQQWTAGRIPYFFDPANQHSKCAKIRPCGLELILKHIKFKYSILFDTM